MSPHAIKFLNAYEKSDIDIFFGRDAETLELFDKVKKSQLTLLYGLSGTGKTSLVQCGLADKFDDGTWLPLFIRRGENFIRSLRKSIDENADILTHPDKPLIEALNNLYLENFTQIILIFDQFEELFISHDDVEISAFVAFLSELLKSKVNCKAIILVREEYLAHFDIFEKEIPSIFDNRMRLERMRRPVVENTVIPGIARASGITLESSDIVTKIADNITDNKGNIELIYLQVYLDKLYHANKKVFSKSLLDTFGKLDDILGDFLEEQIGQIIVEIGNKDLVWKIIKLCITEEGTKCSVSLAEIEKQLGSAERESLPGILHLLESKRIIKNDFGFFELTHDSLAKKISEHLTAEDKSLFEVKQIIDEATNAFNKTGTLMGKKQLSFIRNFENRLSLTPEESKIIRLSKNKRFRIKTFQIAEIILLFALLVFYSIRMTDLYRKFKNINEDLKTTVFQTLKAKADLFYAENNYDSALYYFEKAKSYGDSSQMNAYISQVKEAMQFSIIIGLWKNEIKSLEAKKDMESYKQAIILCDSIQLKKPDDEAIMGERQRLVNEYVVKVMETVKLYEPQKDISSIKDIACEILNNADEFLLHNDSTIIQNLVFWQCKKE